ncbi:MAG: hypothetical protein OHK006_04450 [Thermodesulfovibrionales bacterium]
MITFDRAGKVLTSIVLAFVSGVLVMIPAGYGMTASISLAGTLETEAALNAEVISDIISMNPDTWTFLHARLAAHLERSSRHNPSGIMRIIGSDGRVIAEHNGNPPAPLITRAAPLYDAGAVTGRIEISRSLRPIFRDSAAIFLALMPVCSLLFFLLRSVPVRLLKRSQDALASSEQDYRDLFEHANDAIFIVDADHRYVDVNRKALELFGYTREEFLRMRIEDVIPPDQLPRSRTAFEELASRGSYDRFVGKMRTKDGRWLDIEVSSSAIIRNGAVVGARDIVRDITERKMAQERIAEAEQRYRTFFEQSPDGILIIDQNGGFIDFNEAAHAQLGYTRDEFSSLTISDIDPVENPEAIRSSIADVIAKGTAELNVKHRTKTGEVRDVHVIARTILLDGKAVLHTIWRDVTEKKMLEEELFRAQKLESLGILAGGIAHDFNNLLTGVLGNVTVARQHAGPADGFAAELDRIEKAALRAKDLTQQLLTFAKGGMPIKETVDIGMLVRDAAGFSLRGSSIGCTFSIPDDLAPVEADQSQMSQVFNNLIINAVQAMPSGGSLAVTCRNDSLPDQTSQPQKYVKISIKDTGHGIPRERLSKIFDPYYTTKPNGTGLGLSTSYSIIKKHNGHITVVSEPGLGTTFHIYLPASARKQPPPKEGRRELSRARGGILVMDDDPIIIDTAPSLLAELGYEAETARNGDEAVECFRKRYEHGSPFVAVILDLTVQGGRGATDVVGSLREIDPKVKALVSSGYANDTVLSNFRQYGFSGILTKPYGLTDLDRALQRLLIESF